MAHNAYEIDPEYHEESGNLYTYLEKMKSQGYRVVSNACRLNGMKGLTYFLEAAAKTIALRPKTIFFIAGGGEQLDELLELSAKLGIAKNVVLQEE